MRPAGIAIRVLEFDPCVSDNRSHRVTPRRDSMRGTGDTECRGEKKRLEHRPKALPSTFTKHPALADFGHDSEATLLRQPDSAFIRRLSMSFYILHDAQFLSKTLDDHFLSNRPSAQFLSNHLSNRSTFRIGGRHVG